MQYSIISKSLFITLGIAHLSFGSAADKIFQELDEQRSKVVSRQPSGQFDGDFENMMMRHGWVQFSPTLEVLRAESQKTQKQVKKLSKELRLARSQLKSQADTHLTQISSLNERVGDLSESLAESQQTTEIFRSLYEQALKKLKYYEDVDDDSKTEVPGRDSPTRSYFGDTSSFVSEE